MIKQACWYMYVLDCVIGSVHPSVCPSVRWPVCPLRLLRIHIARQFFIWPRRYLKMINAHERLLWLFVKSSCRLSVSLLIYLSLRVSHTHIQTHTARNPLNAVTQPGRIATHSGLFWFEDRPGRVRPEWWLLEFPAFSFAKCRGKSHLWY